MSRINHASNHQEESVKLGTYFLLGIFFLNKDEGYMSLRNVS
jgi:hypothetical protein